MRIEDLRVGDEVIVRFGGRSKIATIEKETKTQLTADGRRFSKRNGYEIGGGDWGATLDPYTAEKAEAMMLNSLYRKTANAVEQVSRTLNGPTSTDTTALLAKLKEATELAEMLHVSKL